jgi:hypothetical protein
MTVRGVGPFLVLSQSLHSSTYHEVAVLSDDNVLSCVAARVAEKERDSFTLANTDKSRI